MLGFSPVAGIQWVETSDRFVLSPILLVSVPLPGFSGLRPQKKAAAKSGSKASFSPVAGIQWVETKLYAVILLISLNVSVPLPGFSGLRPAATQINRSQEWLVSVPLPGFSGLRRRFSLGVRDRLRFQSRCRDSVG